MDRFTEQREICGTSAVGGVPSAHAVRGVHTASLAHARRMRGEFRGAVADCEQVMAASTGDLGDRRFGMVSRPAISASGLRVECLAELGEARLALTAAPEALRMAEAADDLYSLGQVLGSLINSYVVLGQAESALSTVGHFQEVLHPEPDTIFWKQSQSTIGAVYAFAGRYGEALPLLRAIVEDTSRSRRFGNPLYAMQWLSEVYLRTDRLDDAEEQAQQVLTIGRSHNLPGYAARALHQLGEIAASHEPPAADQAEARNREALGIAEELGMRSLQAHCHLGLGKLYRWIGRFDEARAELETAVAMFREMGMAYWLPEAERELAGTPA